MQKNRPKNLNLFTIHFPIPAIISILHRISGFALFLITPIALWLLAYSLTPEGYNDLQQGLNSFYIKLILWLFLAPFIFHFVAGIRHLLMDIHIGSSLAGGRISSYVTFIVSIILILLAGIWLW